MDGQLEVLKAIKPNSKIKYSRTSLSDPTMPGFDGFAVSLALKQKLGNGLKNLKQQPC